MTAGGAEPANNTLPNRSPWTTWFTASTGLRPSASSANSRAPWPSPSRWSSSAISAPCQPVGPAVHVRAVPEELRLRHAGHRLVQGLRGVDDVVVSRRLPPGDEALRRPAPDHPPAVRGSQRPGHPDAGDPQGVEGVGHPRGLYGVVDRLEHHVPEPPGTSLAPGKSFSRSLRQPEGGMHVGGRRRHTRRRYRRGCPRDRAGGGRCRGAVGRARGPPGMRALVGRKRRIDLRDPGEDSSAQVHGIVEPGALQGREGLRRPDPRLAVQDDRAGPLATWTGPPRSRSAPWAPGIDPGIETMACSAGSRTSTRNRSSPAARLASRSTAVTV